MKNITLIISLLLSLFCTSQAKDRVIERPPFIAWNSTNIEIDKLVISDIETVAYIKAFSQPNSEIKIATGSYLKDNNGHLYPIRKGIGITLDKEFRLSESGEGEFQLVFPPLPLSITTVDFSEGDFKGAYKIWGIQLNKKALAKFTLPEGLKATKVNSKFILPEPINKFDKAILKGKILDYHKGMLHTGTFIFDDVIRGVSNEEKIQINEDGTFYKELNVFTNTPAWVWLSQLGAINFILAPGDTTSITINTRELCRQQSKLHSSEKPYGKSVYFGGYLAGLQQELWENKMTYSFWGKGYDSYLKEIYDMSPEEYKEHVFKKLPELRKQVARLRCSPACKEIRTMEIELHAAYFIAMTERNLKAAHTSAHNLKGEEANKYFDTPMDIPGSYYHCLKELPTIISPKTCYTGILIEMVRYIGFVEQVEKKLQDGLGTDKDHLFDCIKAFRIGNSIKDFNLLNDEQKAQLVSLPASYEEMINAMNNELLKKIEINKKKTGFTINETGQVSNEDLFPSIIAKFQGHTLLVDFWATWCGPCKMANKTMLPMKEDLKDKDILFIYITGETSPLETWNNMIPDIQGEHFRVTESQWSYLRSHFNIEGVPTYFVIDKEGNLTYRETGFPGVDIMKEQLMKALDSD